MTADSDNGTKAFGGRQTELRGWADSGREARTARVLGLETRGPSALCLRTRTLSAVPWGTIVPHASAKGDGESLETGPCPGASQKVPPRTAPLFWFIDSGQ